METKDGRKIISGYHSTEKERQAALNPVQWKRWKELEHKIFMRDTGTINIVLTKNQNRIQGMAGEINPWEHKEGDIGSTIDYCIELGIFTKNQIAILAGSKISKIISHIKHLEKDKGIKVIVNNDDLVLFQNSTIKRSESLIGYYDKVRKVCRESNQEVFSASETKDLVIERFKLKKEKRSSITQADYCYNCVNHGISFNQHIFIRIGQSEYKFVDEHYGYSGTIYYAPKNSWANKIAVGEWQNKEFYLWEKFTDVPEKYYKPELKPNFSKKDQYKDDEQENKSSQFDQSALIDEKTMAVIQTRRGQTTFRNKLLHAYNSTCAITNCNVEAALEAAHIIPHSENQSYHVNRGILLRADIHTLFDLYLISINPQDNTIAISPECTSSYGNLNRNKINLPINSLSLPDPTALMEHFKRWKIRNGD